MTRFTEPYSSGPQRPFQGIDDRVGSPGVARPAVAQSEPSRCQTWLARATLGRHYGGLSRDVCAACRWRILCREPLSKSRQQSKSARRKRDRDLSGRASELTAAPGNTVQQDTSDPSVSWTRSTIKTASAKGSTDGVSVKVPSSVSDQIQGKRIRVTVSARGATNSLAPFALAYSAGENSGWVVFDPTAEFKDYSLRFAVPRTAGSTNMWASGPISLAGTRPWRCAASRSPFSTK